ncbi:hypothetical protein D9M71_631880 [compost metagenome]
MGVVDVAGATKVVDAVQGGVGRGADAEQVTLIGSHALDGVVVHGDRSHQLQAVATVEDEHQAFAGVGADQRMRHAILFKGGAAVQGRAVLVQQLSAEGIEHLAHLPAGQQQRPERQEEVAQAADPGHRLVVAKQQAGIADAVLLALGSHHRVDADRGLDTVDAPLVTLVVPGGVA